MNSSTEILTRDKQTNKVQMWETTWWNVSADNCGLTKYGLTMHDFKESHKLHSTVYLHHLDSSAHDEKKCACGTWWTLARHCSGQLEHTKFKCCAECGPSFCNAAQSWLWETNGNVPRRSPVVDSDTYVSPFSRQALPSLRCTRSENCCPSADETRMKENKIVKDAFAEAVWTQVSRIAHGQSCATMT